MKGGIPVRRNTKGRGWVDVEAMQWGQTMGILTHKDK
jgi:hypothetical protein